MMAKGIFLLGTDLLMSVKNALKLLLRDNAYGLVYQLAAFKYKQCRYGHDAVALCQRHIGVDVYFVKVNVRHLLCCGFQDWCKHFTWSAPGGEEINYGESVVGLDGCVKVTLI